MLGGAATTAAQRARVAAVTAAVAAGYAAQLQATTRAEQERIHLAAFGARAAADRARWNSEARFRAMFTDGHVGVAVLDTSGRVVEANASLCELLGYTPEELETYGTFDFAHPDDEPGMTARIDAVLRGEESHLRLTKSAYRKDGSTIVADVERAGPHANAADLMKAADITLYWAKRDGRDRVALFDPRRHDREVGELSLLARLGPAVRQNEFVLDYQPLVRLADDEVVGVEALVRWMHPTRGRIGPDAFIGHAEESGLIVPLGRWVLAEACRQANEWRRVAPGRELTVSVNVAARQFREPGLVADVAALLAETGLPARCLQLELTESALMGTTGESLDAMHGLAALGVTIAVDDFGTGYSNFAYLRRLPVHVLKLAGPFVAELDGSRDSAESQVVALLIQLAHVLGLGVTAEAVEMPSQMRLLRALGCDVGQGWYFSPPVPPEAITAMLAGRGRAADGDTVTPTALQAPPPPPRPPRTRGSGRTPG